MRMFSRTYLPARVGNLIVAFAFAAAVMLNVCPALASSGGKDAHRHCKTSGSKEPASDDSGCRLKCASNSAPAVKSADSRASFPETLWAGSDDCGIPPPAIGAAPAPVPRTTGPPSSTSQRNAVLLI